MKQLILDSLVLVYDIITKPRIAVVDIIGGMRIREGLLVWIFTLVLPVISAMAQLGHVSLLVFLGTFIAGFLFLIVQIVCVHGVASLLGGKGPIKGLAAGICFSDVPLCFATLIESLVFILPSSLTHLATLAVTIWSIVLAVLAIKTNYGLGTGRSIVALFLPLVLFLCIFAVLAIYFVFSIVSMVKGF